MRMVGRAIEGTRQCSLIGRTIIEPVAYMGNGKLVADADTTFLDTMAVDTDTIRAAEIANDE